MTNAMFCCSCIEKSHHTCITSYFQAWKSPQCPLTDPSLIRQPHPSVGHIMGRCLTPQAIRLTPPATQCTHPWETCLIHQTMLPTLTSKMCRMQSVVYRQQADMFWYFQSVHDHWCKCTLYFLHFLDFLIRCIFSTCYCILNKFYTCYVYVFLVFT